MAKPYALVERHHSIAETPASIRIEVNRHVGIKYDPVLLACHYPKIVWHLESNMKKPVGR